MAVINNIHTFSDYGAEQQDIERRRKMAELLSQQGMQPIEQQMAGGYVVPTSWTQGLAKALQSGLGGYQQGQLRAEQKALGEKAKQEAAVWAAGMPQPRTEQFTPEGSLEDQGQFGMAPQTESKTIQPTKQQMMSFALSGAGNPLTAPMSASLLASALKQDEDFTLGEGQKRFKGGQVIAEGGPRTFAPPAPIRPPQATPLAPGRTRDVAVGNETVTQELQQDGSWKEIGRGPRFARQVAPVVVTGGGSAAQPKAPTGYRYTKDGDLEPIPGGPKDQTTRNKAVAETAAIKAKIVMDKVDEALKETGFMSTGLTGSVLGMIPGTSAYNLDATLDTIKANIGFNELQAMRQASPTGGALGQVAVRELDMLQAVLASLKKGQSQDKLRSGLNQVKQHYSNWKNAVDQSANVEGTQPSSPGVPDAPPPGAVRRK